MGGGSRGMWGVVWGVEGCRGGGGRELYTVQ